MNLYNQAENESLGDELVLLIDKWPNCDQERAIELQEAFNEFTAQGGWEHQDVAKWKPRDGLIYIIKRDSERAARYVNNTNTIQNEIARRQKNLNGN